MILKTIALIIAIIFTIAGLFVKRLAPLVLKRELSEKDILKFKMVVLLVVAICALLVIVPDYI